MYINKVTNQPNYYQKEINRGNNKKDKFILNDRKDNRVADYSIWNELSQKYDITNASFEELNTISKKLYEAKQISLFEHGLLTFNPTRSQHWKEMTKNYPNARYYLTDLNSSGKRDWIAEFEARVERAKKVGNLLGIDNLKRVLGILKKLKNS